MTSTVNAVSTSPESPDGALLRPVGRLGTWLAVLWLVFLVEPLQTAWQERDTAAGMVGLIGTIVFAGVYMWVWLRFRLARARYRVEPPLAESLPALVVLLALSVVLVWSLGEDGGTAVVYVGVAAIITARDAWNTFRGHGTGHPFERRIPVE